MKDFLFVINPHTGNIPPEEKKQQIEAALEQQEQRIQYEIWIPETLEDFKKRLNARLQGLTLEEQKETVIVVVGGDGTITRTLAIFFQDYPCIALGVIPHGTGNLLAYNLGIPTDTEGAVRILLEGQLKQVDVGMINDHYFVLDAGVGYDAEVMDGVERQHKKRLGIWAYFVEGVRSMFLTRQALFQVTVDGKTRLIRGIGVLIINAANLMGPFLRLAPEAKADDGLLDVCVLKITDGFDYLPSILQILTRHYNNDLGHIQHFRGETIKIEAWPRLKVQADGEVIGYTPVEVQVLPRRLNMILPHGEPLAKPTLRSEVQLSVNNLLKVILPPALQAMRRS